MLAGIERADSLVLDPHKWLFQPYDVGCLLVRRRGALDRAFHMTPEYLLDVRGITGGGLPQPQPGAVAALAGAQAVADLPHARADRISAAIARGIELAERAEELLRADARYEVVTPAQLGIVTFALRGAPTARGAAAAWPPTATRR